MLKMRNLKRVACVLIAFLFICECFPLRTSAASAPALTYSIDVDGATETGGTNIFYAGQRGDTVTVRFFMIRTDSTETYSLNTMQNEIEFDMSFFDFVENSISVEKEGLSTAHQTRVRGQEIVKAASMTGSGFATEQLMCTFQLKIKDDAESDHGWVRCSEAKAVSPDYTSAVVTEQNLEVYLKQTGLTVTATGYDAAYDGEEHAVSVTLNVTEGTTVAYSTDNGVTWSENAPSRKDVGTTQVKVRARNDAYFDATDDVVLNVTPKLLTITANEGSKTFGDAGPQLTYSVDGLIKGDSVSGTAEREPGENAGTYAIRQGTLSAGDNYTISFQSADFTIHPKDISKANISLSAHTLNYTGTEQSVSVNAVTLDGTALTEADYSVNTDSATQGTDAGTYTITITGKGNYTGSTSVEWKIVSAGMSAKAENVSVTYDKQPHGITVTDVPSGAAITYSTDGETYSETNPAFTDAGVQVVYYKVTAPGYDEFTGSATVTVAKCPVTVSGIAALNKVYDGTTSAELDFSGVVFDGIVDGDELTVTASGAFDSADAGEHKTVAITGLSLGGESVNNYVLAEDGQQSTAFADITPAGMTVNITGYEGVYDHQAHSPAVEMPDGAEILWSDTEDGTYTMETPSFTNAGTYTVYYRVQRSNYKTVSGFILVTITPKSITGATVLLEQNEFVYNGETHIAVVQTVTLPDKDILSENDYTVSNDRTANAGYYLLTVTGRGNYKDTAQVSWTIKAGSGGISAANINTIYDGNPHSISVAGTPDGAVITYSTDGVTYSDVNPSFTDAGETITVHYKVTAPNYDGFTGSATVTITKRPVKISGIAAENKLYDGNTNATLNYSGVVFDGIVDGDKLTVSATGTFADAEVGNGKTVNITDLTLGGADVGNYQLAAEDQQTETTANITANEMGVTAQGWSDVYDGESHSITVNAPDGAVVTYSTDGVTYSEINPSFTNAGETITVHYKVTAPNYDEFTGSATVTITKRPVKISGIAAENKLYDGTTNATLNYSGVVFDEIVDGDELTVSATGTFENAEVGNGKTVNITDLTLGGADAGNYQLAAEGQQTETTANITANAMNVTASGYSGVYDGEMHSITVNAPDDATVTYSETENGIYTAENPAYKNAGNYTVFYRVEKTNSDTVTGSETVEIRKAEIVPVLRMTDRFNPETERNIWSYSNLAGVPALTVTQADRVVTDYGMTMYRYKEQTATDYLPYSAEDMEVLPVGEYVLRVEIAESKNYLSADTEAEFTIVKAPHENVEAGPFTVLADTENLSVNLISSLVDEASCTVSGFSGSLIGGGVTVTGSTLQFNTGNGESGSIQVTVSSPNYQDYSVTVLLTAGSLFRLSFDSNGGSAVTETRNLAFGAVFGTLPVSTRMGYTFDGWYTAPEGGERVSAATRMSGADTTLYAHWTAEEYTVTLILNGGELNSADLNADGWTVSGGTAVRTFRIDTPDFLLPGAVRDKYSFIGWVQNADEAVLEVTVHQGTTQNLTCEAAWLEGQINGEVEFTRTDENSGILGIKDMDQSDGDTQKSTTSDDEYRPVSLTNAMKEIAADFAAQAARQDVTVTLKTQAVESLTEREESTLTPEERETRREQEAIYTRAEAFYTAAEQIRQDFLSINMEQVVTTYTVDDNGEETGTESDPEPVLEAPAWWKFHCVMT